MDVRTLKDTLAAFMDKPENLDIEKGNLLVQIGEEVLTAEISVRGGQVTVREGGVEESAENWIAHRVANLRLLAERIIETCALDHHFVRPKGEFLDQIDQMPNETPQRDLDALNVVKTFLDRRPAGTCSVLYLTSDAGEGKTTLIKRLAFEQAAAFRKRDVDWLLVPINLGGKPFLRFDDVIAAALLNNFRFRRVYYEGFVQLVRMGYIVPALDGFEEIFVETDEGGAVSSLGTLIRNMKGEGSLLIAARRAYFEFRSLQSQAKLLDALPDTDVSFGRLKLERWGREEFVDFCRGYGVEDPEEVYSDVSARIGPRHPLLTRAVFAKKLVDIVNSTDREEFLSQVRPETEDYFSPFIDRILEREIKEKWIDKYGEPPQPLLGLAEHHELLGLIAEEMWLGKTGSISSEMCSSLAELFCEARHLSPTVTRQVRERLQNHALLVATTAPSSNVAFDHEHFREFFLGEQIGAYLAAGAKADIRKALRVDLIPNWAIDTAVSVALRKDSNVAKLLQFVVETAKSESPASFVRENAGAICARLLDGRAHGYIVIDSVSFPTNFLRSRNLADVEFKNCYFRPSDVDDSTLTGIRFVDCEFEKFGLPESHRFVNVEMTASRIRTLTLREGESSIDIYDPARIEAYLASVGVSFPGSDVAATEITKINATDAELDIIRKLLHVFMRSTQVSESVLTLRLGVHAPFFFSEMKEALVSSGVLQPVKHRGGGQAERYRLGIPIRVVSDALASANGSYTRFLAEVNSTSG
jgi:hypothetical protein